MCKSKKLDRLAGGAALCLVLAGALSLRAQDMDGGDFGKESIQAVTVGDSSAAFDKFAHAQRMERLKQWNIAGDLYQEILRDFPDRVVQSHTDPKTGYVDQYTSVRYKVIELMSKWPVDGLNAYRAKYEPVAASLLASTVPGEYAKVEEVFGLYFITDTGKAAGLRLIDQYFESGQFSAAAWRGELLVERHPNLGADRANIIFRSAIAFHLLGDTEKAKALESKLQAEHADATGTVQGRTVQLVDALKAELINARVPIERHAVAGGRAGAKLYTIALSKPSKASKADPNAMMYGQPQAQTSDIGIFPVEDRGELFFQDGQRIYAVDIESGLPLPGWAQTYGGDRKGQYVVGGTPAPRWMPMSITVTEDAVLAVMGVPLNSQINYNIGRGQPSPNSDTRVVCLDRATGKQRWVAQTKQVAEAAKGLQGLNFVGTPLVNVDTVFVAARGGKGGAFEDCQLLAFDLAKGTFKWSCFISSASVGNPMFGMGGSPSDMYCDLAYDSGRVYVLTNLGTLAAVDAYSGAIAWLSLYPREDTQRNARMMMMGGMQPPAKPVRPWAMDPIIQNDGKLFILPSDGTFLMVYDAGSGLEVKRIAMADLENSDTLLGVQGNLLYACQNKRAVCIDWTTYTIKKATKPVWVGVEFTAPIQGRGFLAGESLIIPTKAGLVSLAADKGRAMGKYPNGGATWNAEKDPGNVLITESHVVVAGAENVDVYTDTLIARAKLDREEQAAPTDANPRLRYAEVMFVGGERAVAMAKLDEAAKMLGGLKSLRPGQARDRLFNDCMQFAEQTGWQTPEARKLTQDLYDRAGAAAANPSQNVNYRLARAKFEAATNNRPAEVTLYQEILADAAMRVIGVSEKDSAEAKQAGTIAEDAIAKILSSGAAEAYAPYQQAAAEALTAALPAGDASRFLSIAQLYPNSKTAPAAMLAAADAYEKAGDSYQANVVLRKILSKYQSAAEKPAVLESLARNYLTMGRHEPQALRYLAQGQKAFGETKLVKPLKVANGPDLSRLTFADAASALHKHNRAALRAPLPDFKIMPATRTNAPQPFKPEIQIAGVDALVTALPSHIRYDRVIGWSAEQGLLSIAPGRAQPVATSRQITEKPLGCAWMGDTAIVWSAGQLAAWKPDGSQNLWRVELKNIPGVELIGADKKEVAAAAAAEDPEMMDNGMIIRQRMIRGGVAVAPVALAAPVGGEQIAFVRPTFDRVIVSTTHGRLFSLKLKDGQVAWNMRLTKNRPLFRLLATDDFTVAAGPSEDAQKWFLTVLDTSTGETVRERLSYPVNNQNALMNLALSDDGMLVYTQMDRIGAIDLYEPTAPRAWETRSAAGRMPFQTMQGVGQLVIADGRVLALSRVGNQPVQPNQALYVYAYSLETGQAIPLGSGKVDALQTQVPANSPTVQLQVADSQMYVVAPQQIQAYNLAKIENQWPSFGVQGIREVFIGRDYLVAATLPPADGPQPAVQPTSPASLRLLGFSRAIGSGGSESGFMSMKHVLKSDSGITAIQPVDGGLYYHTADQKLHFLQGNR